MGGVAEAAPQQATVTGGNSTVTQSGTTTIIKQTTERSSINWQSFSIQPGEQVTFVQPNSSAISLDRVIGAGASTIAGSLTANGQVILINSNGILFEPGASVNLAGLIATTSNVSDSDFMAGKLNFSQASSNTSSATVYNEGTINVSSGGYAVLSAAAVANTGTITAKLGSVVLAGATAFTVDFDGDGLLKYAVTQDVRTAPTGPNGKLVHTLVEQVGTIAADGGQVLLTARAAQGIMHHVINMDGMTEANAVARTANGTLIVGAVTLDGGSAGAVEVTGSIQATNTAGAGGAVEVLGENVALSGVGNIQAWGTSAGGTVLFGGNEHGAGPQANAQSAYVGSGTTITANAVNKGNGGKVVVWSDAATWFAGKINVEGGFNGGNGGFVETSGKKYLGAVGIVDAKAANGSAGQWLLDPTDVTIEANEGGTSGGSFSGGVFTPYSGATALIDPSVITSALNAGTSVDITTASVGSGTGNITVSAPISMASTSNSPITLELDASTGGTIFINSPISVTHGFLALDLHGSVAVNANVQVNNGLTATGNSASDSFTQTAGTTITVETTNNQGLANISLQYDSISLTSVVSNYGNATIIPFSSGDSVGIGSVSGTNLLISPITLSALQNFEFTYIGSRSNQFNASSITIGGTVTLPANDSIFSASSSITINPGAQLTLPNPTSPQGSSNFALKTDTGGSIGVGSGATLSLGNNNLSLISDNLYLPTTQFITNSGVYSTVAIDTARVGGEIDIGTSNEGVLSISSGSLGAFTNFQGLLWFGPSNAYTIDVAGTANLPAQVFMTVGQQGCDCNSPNITFESGAVVTTSSAIPSGANFAGLQLRAGQYGSITESSGASINASRVGIYGGYSTEINIAGSITSTGLEIEAGVPGTTGYGSISLESTASIVTNATDTGTSTRAETVLFTLPGGSITISPGATINFGIGNLALIADNLSVMSAPGAISGPSRVIIAPSSTDGILRGPFNDTAPDLVLAPTLLDAEGVYPSQIGIGSASGDWNVSQQLINALSTNVGRLQIGAAGASGDVQIAGTVNFPAETSLFGGDVLVESSARITVTGTTTFDNPNGAANGLLLNASWDGQSGGDNSLNLSNHGNIGIEPGAVISVGGFLQMSSLDFCTSACNYHPGVLLDGNITAASILYFDNGVGAHVVVGPNAVLTATGSATTGGIQLSPDVGGEISLIGGATINAGLGELVLTTDKLDLAVAGDLTIYGNSLKGSTDGSLTISLSSAGSLSISGAAVLVDTAEAGQNGLSSTSANGLSGVSSATIGIGGATGTLQLSTAEILALSQNSPLYVGDAGTQVSFGGNITPGPVEFIKGCEAGPSCGGTSAQVITALKQVVALAGLSRQDNFPTSGQQSGLGSLDLTTLGFGVTQPKGQDSGEKGSGGPGGFGSGDATNSPSGQAASGPKAPQVTVLIAGKLVALPVRPPIDPGIPGLGGENSSLGNSGLW